jgi:predicted dinucleotide-binding enzyme
MKIGIIGSGNVGGTLGTRWARNGHQVMFAQRRSQAGALRDLISRAGNNAKTGSVAETAAANELLLIATPRDATQQALSDSGDVSGKIIIDATNPLLPDLSGLAVPPKMSGAELVAQWTKGAKVVKAFNTVGANIMSDPTFKDGPVAMFYCGDDLSAKQVVAGLIKELGFDALDAGPLTQARVLEPFALLWISLALQYGYGREIAFRFLRRNAP